MKFFSSTKTIALFLALSVASANGEDESVSDVIGMTKTLCQGGSDTLIGIPFQRPAVAGGKLAEEPRLNGNVAILSATSPAGDFGEIANGEYYLRFIGDSASSGSWHPIVARSGNNITIHQRSHDLSLLEVGDLFEVIPYWTLGSLFPPETQSTVHVSGGPLPPSRATEVLVTDLIREGVSLAPDRLYFITTTGWQQATSGFPVSGGQKVLPGQVIIVRHPEGADDTWFTALQRVLSGVERLPIRTSVRGHQDNVISLLRPVPIKLSELDLSADLFIDSASNSANDRQDELLLFDNATASFNKVPTKTYFRVGGTWREDDGGTYPNANDEEVPIAAAIVLRKAPTTDGRSLIWVNSPRF